MENEQQPRQQQQQGQDNASGEMVRENAPSATVAGTTPETELSDLELLQLQARQGRVG